MFFRSKSTEDEKVRIALKASSLFMPIGKCFNTAESKEAARIIREEAPKALIFIPSGSVLASPRTWSQALSSAEYLIVIGNPALKQYKAFMSFLDNIIFSPVPRKLSAAFITDDRNKALELPDRRDCPYNLRQ